MAGNTSEKFNHTFCIDHCNKIFSFTQAKNRDLPPSDSEESEEEESGDSEEGSDDSDSDDPNVSEVFVSNISYHFGNHLNQLLQSKAKGVEGLIPIENPNRVQKKVKKLAAITENDNPQLSRRER